MKPLPCKGNRWMTVDGGRGLVWTPLQSNFLFHLAQN